MITIYKMEPDGLKKSTIKIDAVEKWHNDNKICRCGDSIDLQLYYKWFGENSNDDEVYHLHLAQLNCWKSGRGVHTTLVNVHKKPGNLINQLNLLIKFYTDICKLQDES